MNLIASLGANAAMKTLGLNKKSEFEKMKEAGFTKADILKLKAANAKQKTDLLKLSITDTEKARKAHANNSWVLGLVYFGVGMVGAILTLLIFFSPPNNNINIIENAIMLLIGGLVVSGGQFYFGASNKEES